MHNTVQSLTTIFVYGSLKRGFKLNPILQTQNFVGEAQTEACYRIFDLGEYPGIVDAENGLSIHGEIYQIDQQCLRQLDEVEGVSEGIYERRQILLKSPWEQSAAQAWFYLGTTNGLQDCGIRWPR